MAWESTFQATQAETRKSTAYDDVSQDLLPEDELFTLEQKWWKRYKFNADPERCPSDYVVTTAARQLKSRRIVAPNFLTVKTLHQQKARTKQRLQIGSAGGKSLEIVEDGAADSRARDLTFDNYFLGVELWAMAWAKAGIDPTASPPTDVEHAGSDSTEYVKVPWEVVKKWLDRAHKSAKKVPNEIRLQWLENRVEADVRIWVEEYRLQTDRTFGKIISKVYTQTASSWYYDALDKTPNAKQKGRRRGRRDSSSEHRDRRQGDRRRDSPQRSRGQPSSHPRRASRMRNGDKLCAAWNASAEGCSEPCPRGRKHLCSILLKGNGRVCGMRNHRACNHKFEDKEPERKRSRGRGRDRRGQRRRN